MRSSLTTYGQSEQVDWPASGWYLRMGQSWHVSTVYVVSLWKLPAEQSEQSPLSVDLVQADAVALPGSQVLQAVQLVAVVLPTSVEN